MSVKGLDKLRTLFAQEAEQRLAKLGQLVLELEQSDVSDLAEHHRRGLSGGAHPQRLGGGRWL